MSAGAVLGVAVLALGAAVLGALLKRGSKEYALLLSAGAAVLIVVKALESAGPLISKIQELAGGGELQGQCVAVMLKAAGLTVLGQLAEGLCKDAGESALAYGVNLAVKTAILAAALPLVARLLEYLGEILSL